MTFIYGNTFNPALSGIWSGLHSTLERYLFRPRNNFKKSAEIEMKKMIEIASEMRENRDSEISLKFSFC